jgi:hypothetical protein
MPRPEDVRFFRQLLEPEVVLASHGVLFGKRDHESHSARHFRDHALRLQRKADESDVDIASPEGVDLGLRRQILKDDVDRRGVLSEKAKGLAQEKPVSLRGDAHGELLRLAARRLPRETGGALRRGRMPRASRSATRRVNATRRGPEEIHFELAPGPESAGSRRLRCSAGSPHVEMKLWRPRQISKMTKLHMDLFYR